MLNRCKYLLRIFIFFSIFLFFNSSRNYSRVLNVCKISISWSNQSLAKEEIEAVHRWLERSLQVIWPLKLFPLMSSIAILQPGNIVFPPFLFITSIEYRLLIKLSNNRLFYMYGNREKTVLSTLKNRHYGYLWITPLLH